MSANIQATTDSVTGTPLTHDGQPLKKSLSKALRREKLRAFLLILPLLAFIIFSFVLPIGDMLVRSVENNIVQDTIPSTIRALASWDSASGNIPGESVYTALADDLMLAQAQKRHTKLGRRLNYDQPGVSSIFRKTARPLRKMEATAAQQAFTQINPQWELPATWNTLQEIPLFETDFPATTQSLQNWKQWVAIDEKDEDIDTSSLLPHGFTYASLLQDLKTLDSNAWETLQADPSGLFTGVKEQLQTIPEEGFIAKFEAIDDGWADIENWQAIQRLSPPIVDSYFLNAVDSKRTAAGIEMKPENERFYGTLFVRTIVMSIVITVMCILLGYPIAYLLANLPVRTSNLILILVLLPFWTSLLVRTSAWKVLLQQQGVINDLLVWVGLIDNTGRLIMINNMTGTIIAMTHILLPFMILPLFSVMKTISPTYMRAAKSMGASDSLAFWRIYFPNTIPGIGAGSILVFILAIGYYITPALVGGTKGVFISNQIAYHISQSGNWGLAAALGAILLVLVLALYWAYDRVVGIDKVSLG